jgi:hypothetical protein
MADHYRWLADLDIGEHKSDIIEEVLYKSAWRTLSLRA